LIQKVISIAKLASLEIMRIYNSGYFNIEIKSDDSPVTKADLIANKIIIDELTKISDYPILTEESPVDYSIRKNWDRYWLVDPLDGTKDFIAKNGEFTINIALIEKNKPILGVVYIPMSGDVYYAEINKGAYKNDTKIYNHSTRKDLVGTDSNFHSTKETIEFFKKHNITNIKKYGSSIKICKLAEGEVDIYPRLNGTKEWDTAASHIIANEAGCKLIDITTDKELTYNKENIKNNFFIASKNNYNIKINSLYKNLYINFVVLSSLKLIPFMKNKVGYTGHIYLDAPDKYKMIDLDNLPANITNIYIEFDPKYLHILWREYNKISFLNIILFELDSNNKIRYYNYKKPTSLLSLSIFKNTVNYNFLTDIYIIDNKLDSKKIYNFLIKNKFKVKLINSSFVSSILNKNVIILNTTNKKYTSNNIFPSYILHKSICDLIDNLDYINTDITKKQIINFLLSNISKTIYNPFAAIAYIYFPKKLKNYNNGNKNIAFYSPGIAYRNNLLTPIIYNLLSKKYNVFFFYGVKNNDKFESYENSCYVGGYIVGYCEILDIILFSVFNQELPSKAKRVYLLHDIYDSPMLGDIHKPITIQNSSKLKAPKLLDMIDYMFIPGKTVLPTKEILSWKFTKNLCFIPGGYFKLDGNIRKFNDYISKVNVDSIIYAPTVVNDAFDKYCSQKEYGLDIIQALLDNFQNYNIIFRHHPHTKDISTSKILNKFKNHPKFIYDSDPSEYMKNYARSKIMISDISGTAFTYSFTTLRSVVFFSPYEDTITKKMGDISYLPHRKNIGHIVLNISEMIDSVKILLNDYEYSKNNIKQFRDQTMFNIESSEEYLAKNIDYILENKKHKDWIYVNK